MIPAGGLTWHVSVNLLESFPERMIPQESEWSRQLLFGFVLAVLLIGLFLLGNPIQIEPAVISAFPSPAAMVPIPVVLFFALWEKRQREGVFSLQKGMLFAETTIRYASVAFGLFTMAYGLWAFEVGSIGMILWSGGVALVLTWLMGMVSAMVLALIFTHLPLKGGRSTTSL